MRLLADEGLEGQVVSSLRALGHDVMYVAEMEPGLKDEFVLRLSSQEGAILVTTDRDFGELVFRQRQASSGVVLIRLSGLSPAKKAQVVNRAFNQYGRDFPNAFTVVSPGSVRVRRSS